MATSTPIATPTFIFKGHSPTLDADMAVSIANEDTISIALAVSLYITGTDKLLDQIVMQLDKKDIEESKAAGTLVSSLEQGYLEMIQEEKNMEVDYHKDCGCQIVH